jgi:hypothetical protein
VGDGRGHLGIWGVADASQFHLSHGEWIDLLMNDGFEIKSLEVQAPVSADTHPHCAYVTADWGRQWPAEEIWVVHKPA